MAAPVALITRKGIHERYGVGASVVT
ncbi:hypothetical protein SAMN05414137_16710, partial [Streptacidiphilus jiangxiensis]